MNDKILDINYQFGKRIKFLRNIRKISQEELAFPARKRRKQKGTALLKSQEF